MRYLLVAACAAIAVGGVFALRSPDPVIRERRVEIPVREEAPVEVPVARETTRAESQSTSELAPETAKRAEGLENRSASLGPQEKMLFLFERELALTGEQRRHFVGVLQERILEVEEYNRRIDQSKVFSRREYSARIRAIRARSYERMAEILDSAQNQRFRQLVAEGRLGDAVAITIDPNWTVID